MQQPLSVSELVEIARAPSGVGLVHADQVVWGSMLSGWRQQQLSRGLRLATVNVRGRTLQAFRDYAGGGPWVWSASDVEDFTTSMRARGNAISTIRAAHGAIRLFCEYLTSPHYDWVEICERVFGEYPSQVCLPWNTVVHVSEYEGRPARRAMTYDEVETFFDCADRRVSEVASSGRKGALAALRDAQMFKTAYVFGLRRAELRGLDMADLHPNARVPHWGKYAAVHVRFAKASRSSSPKRRTVLLVPEFDWWIDGMRQWEVHARPLFGPGRLDAMWVTERRSRVSAAYIDGRFASVRDEAGLGTEHTLHSLRHSYVTHLIEYGYADRFVQEQVGHRHASTTAIYTSVSGDFKNRVLADALRRLTEMERD